MLVPMITVENGRGKPGETAEVRLTISDNPGIAGALLSLRYDPALTLLSLTPGDALTGLEFTPPGDLTANPINLLWDGKDANQTNGTILTLTFAIPAGTPESDYALTVTYAADGIYDGDLNDLDVAVVNGGITVQNLLPGDINGDNVLNAKDVTSLRRCLAGGYVVSFVEALLDVNKDGALNAKDISLLRRALAGGYGVNLE